MRSEEKAPEEGSPVVTPVATRTQRRPLLIVVAVLLILAGAAGGALAYVSIGTTVEALVAREDIQRGDELTAEMFTTAQINPDQQLEFVDPSRMDEFIGQRAAHDIAAGTLVDPGAATAELIPPEGETVVGLTLPPGTEPGVELRVGDKVRVILTEPVYACAAGQSATVGEDSEEAAQRKECERTTHVIQGTVVAVGPDPATGQLGVSVQVAEADAPRAAAAASLGRAALVLDSRDG